MAEIDPNATPTPPASTPPATPPASEADKERERLLTENAEIRKKAKEADAEKQRLSDELAALKKAGHKTSGDWQKVAEVNETEARTWKEKAEKLTKAFSATIVGGKLREEALKQGAKSDMVDLIDSMDFDEVEFALDEENLRFNVKGVDTAISNLKKVRPSFFGSKEAPKFNAGGPGAPQAPKTLEDAKANYVAALKLRNKDPVKFNQAYAAYQQAITDARKASK